MGIELISTDTGEILDILPDIAISMELNNPLFNSEVIEGSYSYPISLPFTPKNDRFFGHLKNIKNRRAIPDSWDFSIRFNGIKMLEGKLVFISASKNYQMNFLFDGGALAALMNNTLLKDLPWGEPEQINDFYEYIEYNISASAVDYLAFYDIYGTNAITNTIDTWHTNASTTAAHLANTINTLGFTGYDVTVSASGSTLRVTANKKGAFQLYDFDSKIGLFYWNGANPNFDPPTNPYGKIGGGLSPIVVPNTDTWANLFVNPIGIATHMDSGKDWNFPDVKYCFPVLRNDDAYTSSNASYKNYINYYDDSYFANLDPGHGSAGDRRFAISPQFFLFSIFEKIEELTGYSFTGNSWNDAEFQRLFVYNNVLMDRKGTVGSDDYNFWTNYIHHGDHMPEMTAFQLLNYFRLTFNIGVFINNKSKVITLTPAGNILSSTEHTDVTSFFEKEYVLLPTDAKAIRSIEYSIDSSDASMAQHMPDISKYIIVPPVSTNASLPTDVDPNVLCLVQDENKYYISSFDTSAVPVIVWDSFSENLYNYSEPIPAFNSIPTESINIGADTPYVEYTGEADSLYPVNHGAATRNWKIPFLEQPATFKAFERGNGSFGLRWLFYRGMQDDGNGNAYPFATNDEKDYGKNTIGYYSLHMDGDKGIYNLWYKDWFNFLNTTRIIQRKSHFTAAELSRIDWGRKYMIENNLFLFRKISFTLYKDKIGDQMVEMLKV